MAFTFSVELNFGVTDNTMCFFDDELVKEFPRFFVVSTFNVELTSDEINDSICCLDDELKKFVEASTFSATLECDDTVRCLDEETIKGYDRLSVASPFTKELYCGHFDDIMCCLDGELDKKFLGLVDATSTVGW